MLLIIVFSIEITMLEEVVHMLEEAEPCNFIDIVVKKECEN